jgi:cyclopropane-fatty-acyl-phospholipid synthase
MQPRAVARTLRLLDHLFGPPRERAFDVRLWNGEVERGGASTHPSFTLVLRHEGALRRMLLPPTEISLGSAFLRDDFDVEGDLEESTSLAGIVVRRLKSPRRAVRVLAALAASSDGPGAKKRVRRWPLLHRLRPRHSPERDAAGVRFHYDLGNEFYALWLDERMVYSCAYFRTGAESLDEAQRGKLDLCCRKLRLRPGERLLDIGCGWGGLVLHAARHYGVEALGVTLSEAQAALARRRIAEAGLSDRCRVEVLDYRHLPADAAFDKVVSVGMVEHVGGRRLPAFFSAAWRALRPGGLFLCHGIVSIADARPAGIEERLTRLIWRRHSFIQRYIFPDGVLVPAATGVRAAEAAGFETRDAESLREHYARTLRLWSARLAAGRDEAVRLVGEPTYRAWRLYLAASARGFATGRLGLLQVLYAKHGAGGRAHLPLTREDLLREGASRAPDEGGGAGRIPPAAATRHSRTAAP